LGTETAGSPLRKTKRPRSGVSDKYFNMKHLYILPDPASPEEYFLTMNKTKGDQTAHSATLTKRDKELSITAQLK
jgi:hypothetical protein